MPTHPDFKLPRARLAPLEAALAQNPEQWSAEPLWSQISSLDFRIAELIGDEAEPALLSTVAPARRLFLALESLERETNHGGLEHFFFYHVELAPFALEACEMLDLPRAAEMLRRARAIFPGDRFPVDVDESQGLLLGPDEDRYSTAFEELENLFFAEPYEPFLERRLHLVVQHAADFFLDA
jgi:hypothetical protein